MPTIFANVDNATVNGTSDPETIVVRGSNDTISGFGGNDVIFSVGDANLLYGDSTVGGGPNAGTGTDILVGGAGDDTLWGGAAADTLQGGGGADTFSFGFVPQARLPVLDTGSSSGQNDLIVDFSQAQHDVINLSALSLLYPALPAVFLGTGAFTSDESLQVRYEVQDGYTAVQIRVPLSNDPSRPVALTGEIDLAGVVELTADDFVLAPALGDAHSGDGSAEYVPPTQVMAKCASTEHWFM